MNKQKSSNIIKKIDSNSNNFWSNNFDELSPLKFDGGYDSIVEEEKKRILRTSHANRGQVSVKLKQNFEIEMERQEVKSFIEIREKNQKVTVGSLNQKTGSGGNMSGTNTGPDGMIRA